MSELEDIEAKYAQNQDEPEPARVAPKDISKLQPREVIESLFKVETKSPGPDGLRIIDFKLNPTQLILDAATAQKKMHAVLKARQLGCSTYIEARFLAKCMTIPGTRAAVVSHERQATARLLRRVHFFLDNLPVDRDLLVPTKYDNKYEITFPKMNSSFYIGTAGQRAFTRGDMITDFHGSEVAYWPDPDQLMAGVAGALTPDAEVFLESTANGMGGYFFAVCDAAMKALKNEDDEHAWMFHFFPWHQAIEYRRPVKVGTLWTPEELWLQKTYSLDFEQLAWRRWKMAQYRQVETFYQEFPMEPEEAFIVTGTCYFDKVGLRLYSRMVQDPVGVGGIELLGDEARFMRYDTGNLKIWEWPKAGIEYLIAADISEGIESSDSDNSHFQVVNREKFSQAASINGKIDPHEAAKQLYALGKFYHWCWIAVEDNGPGLACLLKLKELGYPRLYRHRRWDLEKQQETDKLGWHTDLRTRPLILSELRTALRSQTYLVRDKELLMECSTFCRQKDSGYKANEGCHDDRVLANAIAVYLHKVLPYHPEDVDDRYGRSSSRAETLFIHGYKTGY